MQACHYSKDEKVIMSPILRVLGAAVTRLQMGQSPKISDTLSRREAGH